MKKILKIIFYIIPTLSLLVIFNTSYFPLFGEISFYILIVIMFSRPLKDIFPKKLALLRYIIGRRKELGIIVGTFAMAHVLGYFIYQDLPASLMFDSNIWFIDSFLAWGFLAFFVSIPLLFTSNKFSVLKLGKNWKKLQYLAYLMFVFVILHIAFLREDEFILMMFLLGIYIFVLILSSYLKKKNAYKTK